MTQFFLGVGIGAMIFAWLGFNNAPTAISFFCSSGFFPAIVAVLSGRQPLTPVAA
jgi:uncharacterized membrane protein YgaE (UPF0421/DUF939 family)